MGQLALLDAGAERDAVQELEELGYPMFWFGEGPGYRESFAHAATLLAWTRNALVATGIASIYVRDAMATMNGARTLADAFPLRFVLGVGVSHRGMMADRGHTYGPPVATMRAYLDEMSAIVYRPPAPVTSPPLVLAALGPEMLALAAQRADGVHPYLTPPAHTALARKIVGPNLLVAPEQAFLLETDAERAREVGRTFVSYYLRLENYRRNLLRLGYTEADCSRGGSDRLIDDLIAWGEPDDALGRVIAHLEAGADHVCVQAIGPKPLEALRQLAPRIANFSAASPEGARSSEVRP